MKLKVKFAVLNPLPQGAVSSSSTWLLNSKTVPFLQILILPGGHTTTEAKCSMALEHLNSCRMKRLKCLWEWLGWKASLTNRSEGKLDVLEKENERSDWDGFDTYKGSSTRYIGRSTLRLKQPGGRSRGRAFMGVVRKDRKLLVREEDWEDEVRWKQTQIIACQFRSPFPLSKVSLL